MKTNVNLLYDMAKNFEVQNTQCTQIQVIHGHAELEIKVHF
jgi:hypothetical protein